jgi:hypothetical protein
VKSTLEAFAYPLRPENLGVMLLGVAVLSILYSIVILFGRAVEIEIILLSYYVIFLQSILHTSMEGRDKFPAWPEAQGIADLFEDFFSILVPFLVAFLPVMLLRASVEGFSVSPRFIFSSAGPASLLSPSPAVNAAAAVLLIAGWLYLPMAILVWNFYGGRSILDPVAVVKAAWKTGPDYLLLVLKMAVLVTAAWSVTRIPDKVITTFGASLLTFYSLVVSMRLLGTFYRTHRATLGFERELPEPA